MALLPVATIAAIRAATDFESIESATGSLFDQTGLPERRVGAVLADGLEGAGGELDFDVAAELGNPEPLDAEVRRKGALDLFDVVEADPALLLSETAVNDFPAALGAGSGDAADPGHRLIR